MSKKIEIKRLKITEAINKYNQKNSSQPPISRKFLANKFFISYTTIHHWDKGNTVPDAILNLYKLSQYLGCTMEELIELKNITNE